MTTRTRPNGQVGRASEMMAAGALHVIVVVIANVIVIVVVIVAVIVIVTDRS